MIAHRLSKSASALALLTALGLAGCDTTSADGGPAPVTSASANTDAATPPATQRELPDAPLGDDPLSRAAYWGTYYDQNPSAAAAVEYAGALRDLGSTEESISFLSRVSPAYSEDAAVQSAFAKALVDGGRSVDAMPQINRAIALDPSSWQMNSLAGVAYDQAGDNTSATASYERALQISPNNPLVLNNYGLSRALAGDLDGAESLLRAAVEQPGATAQVRQNLALILGLQGNFAEAEQLARQDLPVEAVSNNVEYYRSMLTQPSAYGELTGQSH